MHATRTQRAARHAPTSTGSRTATRLTRDLPVVAMYGVGEQYAERLKRLGIERVRDLLYHFPLRYEDYSQVKSIRNLRAGESATFIARVKEARLIQTTETQRLMVHFADDTGSILAVWFGSQAYLKGLQHKFKPNSTWVVSGKPSLFQGRLNIQNPATEAPERECLIGGSIAPVYPLTEGISQMFIRRLVRRAVEHCADQEPEPLPSWALDRFNLPPIAQALRNIHMPPNAEAHEQARRRFVFDHLLKMQILVRQMRHARQERRAAVVRDNEGLLPKLVAALPFRLTQAQQRVLDEIVSDLASPVPMHRLLQGDVGSGKTVVAALVSALVLNNHMQVALMAPTELLAEQHYRRFSEWFETFCAQNLLPHASVRLITGSTRERDRAMIQYELAHGAPMVVIGTHALIQESVLFSNLGLVIIDEQHRFGVAQREKLVRKGSGEDERYPHILVMTATPIPRTLALTTYGHMEISIIDEMPAGRKPVKTYWITPNDLPRLYQFVREQLDKGHQAYIVYPIIDDSDQVAWQAASTAHARLQSVELRGYRLGLLHGRLSRDERERVMREFQQGHIQALVTTTVIEVGIDVSRATVMVIENAERFGLAQLHQLRGRVGRGAEQSYCFLVARDNSALADQRLHAITNTYDGMRLAELDLQIRGPGELFGLRQSGAPDIPLLRADDRIILEWARETAEQIVAQDPTLASYPALRDAVEQLAQSVSLT